MSLLRVGLKSRQKDIIKILVKFTALNPITIFAISQKLGFSERTILRELPYIEKWFLDNHFNFERKPGVGLIINENDENKKLILALLDIENTKSFSREERRKFILLELLSIGEPLKSFYFICEFKISDGALNNDLDFLNEYLKYYNIKIVRKQGIGVYLVGDEINYRQVIISLIYDFLDEKEILKFLTGKSKPIYEISTKSKIFNFIDNEITKGVEIAILNAKKSINFVYTDSAYIGFIIYICICVKRIKKGYNVYIKYDKLKELINAREYTIAKEIAKELSKNLNIIMSDDEIGFIIMYIIGARIWEKDTSKELDVKEINLRKTVIKIIEIVENETNVYLRGNKLLIEDLVSHISIVISRISMNIKIKNSSYKMIKQNYTQIYETTKKACEILKNITCTEHIPEEEIASIAMYFCAVIYAEQKIYVAIVCTNGIGTSRMLATDLTREFNGIEVVDVVSAINININKLFEDGIDIIISTVDLEDLENVICVNPILLEEDKLLIRKALTTIKNNKFLSKRIPVPNREMKRQDIKLSIELGTQILNLLDNIRLIELKNVTYKNEVLKIASEMFATNKEIANDIYLAFKKREEISSTYISDLQVTLLHCKNKNIDKCCFGYVRFGTPFNQEDLLLYGAIVMIIPSSKDDIYTQIMSEVSRAIIEDKEMINALKFNDLKDIKNKTEKNLGRFFKKSILK